jgi:bisphosphoglycerate-dependent phosphoglycerate mutase
MEILNDNKQLYDKTTNGNILYIRHGESKFNNFAHLKNSEVESKRIKEFIDCDLSDLGVTQSEDLSKEISQMKIKYVFCSPLLRCIKTCYNSLKNHPDKDNIIVIIHPLITETINCNHDFSVDILNKKKLFNIKSEIKFDWSLFDEYYPQESVQESYYLDFIDTLLDEEKVINIKKRMRENDNYKNNKLMQNLAIELSVFYSEREKRPETLRKLFERNLKFKLYLKEFLNKNTQLKENEKVVVYTHSNFIMLSISKICFSLDIIETFPDDCYKPNNCEIISIFI